MPPKRKAAASRKAATPAARRQKTAEAAAAAAEPAEETTAVEVPGSRKDWLAPFHEMYVGRELTDVVLVVGDRSVAAHRVVLAAVSPRWKAQFCGKMAESQGVRQEVRPTGRLVEYALPANPFSSNSPPSNRAESVRWCWRTCGGTL